MDKVEREVLKHAIYEIVRTIPYGRATSYGAIAKAIGYPNLSRLVGKIMSESNGLELQVPAHRVVNGQGILSAKDSFGTSADQMQKLLEREEIKVVNNRIKSWKQVYWNPLVEIQL